MVRLKIFGDPVKQMHFVYVLRYIKNNVLSAYLRNKIDDCVQQKLKIILNFKILLLCFATLKPKSGVKVFCLNFY